jgi:hypothetical protein
MRSVSSDEGELRRISVRSFISCVPFLLLMGFTVPVSAEATAEAVRAKVTTALHEMNGAPVVAGDAGWGAAACDSFEPTILGCNSSVPNASLTTNDCILQGGYIMEIYRLNVTKNTPVTLRVTSSQNSAILLAVHDPDDGEIVQSNTAAKTNTVTFTPEWDGTYLVSVTFTTSLASGSYALTVTCAATIPTSGDCRWKTTLCGANVVDSLAAGDCVTTNGYTQDKYAIKVVKGQTVTVNVKTQFPGYIFIGEGVGTDFQNTSTSQTKRDSTVSLTATDTDGWTYFYVTAFDKSTGGYSMTVSCESAGSPCKRRSAGH